MKGTTKSAFDAVRDFFKKKPRPAPAADRAVVAPEYSLVWCWGGVDGSGCVEDPAVRISALRWVGHDLVFDSAGWPGWADFFEGDKNALVCMFMAQPDGTFHGGKFDWARPGTRKRDLLNIEVKDYNGWRPQPVGARLLFCVCDITAGRRSNFLEGSYRKNI